MCGRAGTTSMWRGRCAAHARQKAARASLRRRWLVKIRRINNIAISLVGVRTVLLLAYFYPGYQIGSEPKARRSREPRDCVPGHSLGPWALVEAPSGLAWRMARS